MKYTNFEAHHAVVEAVIRGEFEAGTLKKDIAEKYIGFGIRILKESPKWPGVLVVANLKTLSKDKTNSIKNALLSLNPKEVPELVFGKYGFAQVVIEDLNNLKKYEKYAK
jgi:ABC-type phosphate/phosphonate transport system substrate-binding protein